MALLERLKIIDREVLHDNRGWFLKVINGKEENLPNYTGEIYLTCAKKNQIKGGHYHEKANEWFTLVLGTCNLHLYDLESNETCIIPLDSVNPKSIYVPCGIAHTFVNTGKDDFLLLAYSDLLYDPSDTIMFDFPNL